MSEHLGRNLSRLMAEAGLSIAELAEKASVDERTVRGILAGGKPHARTLHELAAGLGVAVDEFFLDPAQLLYRRFDRQTNPMVDEVFRSRPGLFAGWSEADFDELHSRVGAGGALTFDGTLAAVDQMNRSRELHEKLAVLLESSHSELIGGMIDLAYRQIAAEDEA